MAETMAEQQQFGGDRVQMLKAFDETNAGVKGLIDSGLQKLPAIFVRPSDELAKESTNNTQLIESVPVIDLSDVRTAGGRRRILEEVAKAAETLGFFQVVNHGIPSAVVDGMIDGVRRFHEQDVQEKRKYYTRDLNRSVRFNSNYDLFTSKTALWKDTLSIALSKAAPDDAEAQEIPPSCRESSVEYSKHVGELGDTLFGLLSESLGLETDHLKNMECSNGLRLHCHYYPPCPEPQLAIGTHKHADPGFVTILLQSQNVSALQILYEGQWVDIEPTPGGLVVNIGDLLQLVSNGRFKSIEHRAMSNLVGPRISVACFFTGPPMNGAKAYGPIRELISEENPAMFKEIVLGEYVSKFFNTGLDDYRALDYYKL